MIVYDKVISLKSKILVELNNDGVIIGKYLLEDDKLYKVETSEKYTLIKSLNL
jgi:hypothetical protein